MNSIDNDSEQHQLFRCSDSGCVFGSQAPEVEKVGQDALDLCCQVVDLGFGGSVLKGMWSQAG